MPTTRLVTSPPRVPTMRRWRRSYRRAALGGLLLFLLALGLAVFLTSAVTHPVHASPTRYGTDAARMQAAVQAAGWPQKSGVWCGIADIAAIVDYRNPAYPIDQNAVVNDLNSSARQSAWGTPDHNWNIAWGPGFLADISRDGGTDPRSMAAGLSALAGANYHQLVDYRSAYNATAHLVSDLVRTREPIAVFVNAGSHSVLVSAVFAYGDPTNLDNVASLEVYDPGAGLGVGVQHNQVERVSLNGWIWWWGYLGATYQDNKTDGRHALDPDPSIGPYTYDPSQGRNVHLWIGHFVYIHPDSVTDASNGVSPDWAFNQDGALIRGLHDEAPADYTGPSVAMVLPPPPPPPPPTPTNTPTNTPLPTRTPRLPHDPTFPSDEPTLVGSQLPMAAVTTPTAVPGSIFGLSLHSICFSSACAGADTVSMLMLGGASSLSATALLLVGALMVRRRRRRATPARAAHPAGEPLAQAASQEQSASEASEGAATPSADDTPAADDPSAAAASSLGQDAISAADEVSTESGPLALRASASERQVQLAEPTEATEDSADALEAPADAETPQAIADAPAAEANEAHSAASAVPGDATLASDIVPAPSDAVGKPSPEITEPPSKPLPDASKPTGNRGD